MTGYIITGKLGTGKSLAAVGRMRDYLNDGRRVATNLDLYLENLVNPFARNVVCFRLPDKPRLPDLEALPVGNPTIGTKNFTEDKNGALVLDECGSWLNTRNWNDKDRKPMLDWMIHARKKGWDTFFLVQGLDMVDNQARMMLGEHVVECRRYDKLGIPFVSTLTKQLIGYRLTWPKIHLGVVRYGESQSGMIVDRWWYRGRELYDAYDTTQIFHDRGDGTAQYLPPYHVHGRFQKRPFSWESVRSFLSARSHWGFVAAMLSVVFTAALGGYFFWSIHETQAETKEALRVSDAAIRVSKSALAGTTTSPVNQSVSSPESVPTRAPKLSTCSVFDGYRISSFLKKTDGGFLYMFDHQDKASFISSTFNGGPYKFHSSGSCAVRITGDNCMSEITCAARVPGAARSTGSGARASRKEKAGESNGRQGNQAAGEGKSNNVPVARYPKPTSTGE